VFEAIPSGLHIKLLPQTPGSDSNSLNHQWNQTLFHCSKRLLILLKSHCEEHLKQLTTEFHSLLDICKKDLLVSEYENISKRLNDISAMKVWLSINDNAVNPSEMAVHTNQRP
jgi:hypothetical protein